MTPRPCPCCSGGEPLWCPDCCGTDEHPSQHCQDCPQLDSSPSWSCYSNKLGYGEGSTYWGQVKGCTHCGFTGFADQPAYGGHVGCPRCGQEPDQKKLARKPPTGR
jgi:hypothetical protein